MQAADQHFRKAAEINSQFAPAFLYRGLIRTLLASLP